MSIKSPETLINEALKQIKTLDLKEVKQLIDEKSCTLIDIRDIRELSKGGAITDAFHIPRGMLEFWLNPESPYVQKGQIDLNKKVILFCQTGDRSALATKTLQDMGLTNVAHVKGGYKAMASSGIFQLMQLKKKDK